MAYQYESLIPDLIAGMGKRQMNIIKRRFGLADGEPCTLAQLGEEYGITRERIRQIESAALATVRERIHAHPHGKRFVASVRAYLSRHGNARREKDLVADFCLPESKASESETAFAFLLAASGAFSFRREDHAYHALWHDADHSHNRVATFLESLENDITKKKEAIIMKSDGAEFRAALARIASSFGISSPVAENYLALSKRFARNPYGDRGLSSWPEILPKTMRDRAYLVLKKDATPLHFHTIAERINALTFANPKQAHPSTVHNELIKDKRFVLVGRGTYSLAEHGHVPGTAKDVIARILKMRGPLPAERIIALVQNERLFQKNTILLNLQNKKLFQRQADGSYRVNAV